jgi:hypothetical protein
MSKSSSIARIPLASIVHPRYAKYPDFEQRIAQALLEQGDNRPFVVEKEINPDTKEFFLTGWLKLYTFSPSQPEREESYLETRWHDTYDLPDQDESPSYYWELATGQHV